MPKRILASHALAATAMSLPWSLLLILTWQTTGSAWWLGVVGAARMAPYVMLSWAAGRPADRFGRARVVRFTLAARFVALSATALFVYADQLVAAVIAATVAIAVATPAYPALAAAMPQILDRATARRATNVLVTIEVSAWVIGPGLGGLLIHHPVWTFALAICGTALAWVLLRGFHTPMAEPDPAAAKFVYRDLLRNRALVSAIGAVAIVNVIGSALTIVLLQVTEVMWRADEQAYGIGTSGFGFGSLLGPALVALSASDHGRVRVGFLVMALPGAVLMTTANVWWALAPLVLMGAAAVLVEGAATAIIQDEAPADATATILGVGDSAMVGAAMVASLVAPAIAQWTGPAGFLAGLAGLAFVARWLVRAPSSETEGVRPSQSPSLTALAS